jgi:Lipocalin-like domain
MATDAHEEIVGAWRLVHSVEFMEDGRTRYPLGQDAVGYIVYSK